MELEKIKAIIAILIMLIFILSTFVLVLLKAIRKLKHQHFLALRDLNYYIDKTEKLKINIQELIREKYDIT